MPNERSTYKLSSSIKKDEKKYNTLQDYSNYYEHVHEVMYENAAIDYSNKFKTGHDLRNRDFEILEAKTAQEIEAQKNTVQNDIVERYEEKENNGDLLIRQPVDDQKLAEHYNNMKNLVKSVKKIDFDCMSLNDLTEWAMSSAMVDGGSPQFMEFVRSLMDYNKIDQEYKLESAKMKEERRRLESADMPQEERGQKIMEISNQEGYYSVRKSAFLHDLDMYARFYLKKNTGRSWSTSTKMRHRLAKNIVGKITGWSKVRKPEGYNEESEKFRRDIRKITIHETERAFRDRKDKNSITERFNREETIGQDRDQIKSFYDWTNPNYTEYDRKRNDFLEAMKAEVDEYDRLKEKKKDGEVTQEDRLNIDRTPMFRHLDKELKMVMEYTIPKDIYSKKWILKNPNEVIKLYRLASMSGDVFSPTTGIMTLTMQDYMYRLHKDKPEVYDYIYSKMNFLFQFWTYYEQALKRMFGLNVLRILANAGTGLVGGREELDTDGEEDNDESYFFEDSDTLIKYIADIFYSKKVTDKATGKKVTEYRYTPDHIKKVLTEGQTIDYQTDTDFRYVRDDKHDDFKNFNVFIDGDVKKLRSHQP